MLLYTRHFVFVCSGISKREEPTLFVSCSSATLAFASFTTAEMGSSTIVITQAFKVIIPLCTNKIALKFT